ncbi:MAG: TIGR01244 family sulfur transferase [Cypionkella sp.]|nr:TIGR01244 family sulfur transferase [Cypionkella sp.]
MDIRQLTPSYAVSPQIALDDLPRLKALGFTDVIDNRPDSEIPPEVHTDKIRAAAQAAGLNFHPNPVIGGAITEENVRAQAAAIAGAKGLVFAYCASGNRSSIVWALAHRGRIPADDLIATAAQAGYNLEHLRAALSQV